jgi:hypothetical protein
MDEPNGPRLVASEGQAVAKEAPPGLLDMIKDDLNIPPTDTTNDAWLQRRIDNVWARFEKYCCRALPVPPAQFIDDWTLIAEHSNRVEPWVLDHWPIGSPFLRYTPVVSIDAITSGWPGQTADLDPTQVMFEPASGKLFGLSGSTGAPWAHDVTGWLRQGAFRITYTAGWTECPGDLYEALLNIIMPMWQGRVAQQAGGGFGGGTISRINIVDVGEVDLDTAGAFVEAASRARGGGDPMLGPWITLLDSYVDVRVQMGSPLIPVTTAVVPP